NRERDRVGSAGCELIFTGEPEIVFEIVMYRAIRSAELERVAPVNPGDRVFELQAPLMDNVWSTKGSAKPRETADYHTDLRRIRWRGHCRIPWRDLTSELIDDVASEVMGPADHARVIAIC